MLDIFSLQAMAALSLLSNEKITLYTMKLFAYIFGISIKFGYKNPSILTPWESVEVTT
jgi:hypothetical protein